MVSSVVIHQMSKIEKQTISIILTKYKSIDKHMQATKDNQGGKKISDGNGAQTNFNLIACAPCTACTYIYNDT